MWTECKKEMQFLLDNGWSKEKIEDTWDVCMSQWSATNRRSLAGIKEAVRKIENDLKMNPKSETFEPFFVKNGEAWAVKARGIDFLPDHTVKVRRKDGTYAEVEVLDTIDYESKEVRLYTII
ncbi:hypothetical protein [Kineothrix sp. MB12-C1]|uniref:hypothetical protein n=1 Tax=Kineothrix sp. MB12-C1 TaxID=3070215 RepID=UPI0027D2A9EE|nr:hypothetical protein [Kineothrix sp. MB12-C1]WMC91276.1 hypothetical protein RBB56_10305 [Kineothrix sp. MB12-C1]